jgi:hypothetical protein
MRRLFGHDGGPFGPLFLLSIKSYLYLDKLHRVNHHLAHPHNYLYLLWCLQSWIWQILHHPTYVMTVGETLPITSRHQAETKLSVSHLFTSLCLFKTFIVYKWVVSSILAFVLIPIMVSMSTIAVTQRSKCFLLHLNEMMHVILMHIYNFMFKHRVIVDPTTDRWTVENWKLPIFGKSPMMLWLGRLCPWLFLDPSKMLLALPRGRTALQVVIFNIQKVIFRWITSSFQQFVFLVVQDSSGNGSK